MICQKLTAASEVYERKIFTCSFSTHSFGHLCSEECSQSERAEHVLVSRPLNAPWHWFSLFQDPCLTYNPGTRRILNACLFLSNTFSVASKRYRQQKTCLTKKGEKLGWCMDEPISRHGAKSAPASRLMERRLITRPGTLFTPS